MNKRIAIILVVALTGGLALGGVTAAQAGKDQAGAYAVRIEAAAGGSYHLDGGGWQVQGAASSPGYHLVAPAGATGGGTPCCCSYLPCLFRRFP